MDKFTLGLSNIPKEQEIIPASNTALWQEYEERMACKFGSIDRINNCWVEDYLPRIGPKYSYEQASREFLSRYETTLNLRIDEFDDLAFIAKAVDAHYLHHIGYSEKIASFITPLMEWYQMWLAFKTKKYCEDDQARWMQYSVNLLNQHLQFFAQSTRNKMLVDFRKDMQALINFASADKELEAWRYIFEQIRARTEQIMGKVDILTDKAMHDLQRLAPYGEKRIAKNLDIVGFIYSTYLHDLSYKYTYGIQLSDDLEAVYFFVYSAETEHKDIDREEVLADIVMHMNGCLNGEGMPPLEDYEAEIVEVNDESTFTFYVKVASEPLIL